MFLTEIDTGKSHVQWEGDGKFQPATPIAHFTLPDFPGGVDITSIQIH